MFTIILVFFSMLQISWAQLKNFSDISVFRIADSRSYTKEGDLGHCTGFIYDNKLYTAAHCNHFLPFWLVNKNGKIFLDLTNKEKFYLKNEFGLLDTVTMNLEASDLEAIQKNSDHVNAISKGVQILGFPIFLRPLDATVLDCQLIPESNFNFRHKLEISMGNIHFTCNAINHVIEQNPTALMHNDVKGLSGGPLVVDGKIRGVVYHYDEPRGEVAIGAYKALLFDNNQLLIPESTARRVFQLDQRTLEQVKQPNKALMDLEMALITKQKDGFLGNVKRMTQTTTGWKFEMQSGKTFEIAQKELPDSVNRLLISVVSP